MKPKWFIDSVRLRNFKAIRDSGLLKLTPLTVLIGNNGSGKSSLVEALFTMKLMCEQGLNAAMQQWVAAEHIFNKASRHRTKSAEEGAMVQDSPMQFELKGRIRGDAFRTRLKLAVLQSRDQVSISQDEFHQNHGLDLVRPSKSGSRSSGVREDRPFFAEAHATQEWQFLTLQPHIMGFPRTSRQAGGGRMMLAEDGSNIAEYVKNIHEHSPEAFESLVEAMRAVLPYARSIRTDSASLVEKTLYLSMTEKDFKVPGWMLSTGTLRVLALLAVLRHPNPARLVVIEEIENGLDPRTIHLLVEEIRNFLMGGGQVIITTHSPYLLDLLDLSHIVVVERNEAGSPTFERPSKIALKGWADKFAPGRLYTMGNLTKN